MRELQRQLDQSISVAEIKRVEDECGRKIAELQKQLAQRSFVQKELPKQVSFGAVPRETTLGHDYCAGELEELNIMQLNQMQRIS